MSARHQPPRAASSEKTDVGNPTEVADLCEAAIARFGRLDVMVNNAWIAAWHPRAEAVEARTARFWRTHILGVQTGIKDATARTQAGGAIVNISSVTVVRCFVNWDEYAATTAGIISLTQTAGVEYGP